MIDMSAFAGTPVAVLGLGRSGTAAARALLAGGCDVRAWDDNAETRARSAAAGIPLADPLASGLDGVRTMVLSPGIPHGHPHSHPAVGRARAAGCEIVADMDLLGRTQVAARYVGITGTNGKSTTTALIGHVLNAAGLPVQVGGNLGPPALELAPLGADGVYVLEMSSYQLELVPTLTFDIAVLLNIGIDHLDRHGGFDGYVAAKRGIFDGQDGDDTAIVGMDDDSCRVIAEALAGSGAATVVPISGHTAVAGGVYVLDGALIDATAEPTGRRVFDLGRAVALPGEHNAQNAAAAYAAARAVGIATTDVCASLATFPGLAHRQEHIAEVRGVIYVNDSKATNPEAAAKALQCYDAVYWIAGGRPKDAELDPLLPYLSRVRHAFLIGEAEDPFAAALDGHVPLTRCGTLDRAFDAARRMAEADGGNAVVLLSPACASFDQFANFEARGEAFRALVEGLPR